jgi:spermidine synthase
MEEQRDMARGHSARNGLVVALFLASGATALVYEVVWTRLLTTTVFGSTSQAISTVLAAFMAGLALGAYWLAPRADDMKRPLRLYAVLEAGIGVYAFAFPLLVKGVLWIYLLFATGRDPNALLGALRFGLAFAVLLLPSTMMGATLPALVRYAARSTASVGRQTGIFYAVNTAGAVLGTLLAAFVLIRTLGVTMTLVATGVVNLVIALVAWRLGSDAVVDVDVDTDGAESDAPAEAEYSPRLVRAATVAFAVSGFCALAYEVLWTRILVFFLGSTTYAFATMLAAFLTGIAAGSAFASRWVERVSRPGALLGAAQVAIGISAVVLLPLFGEIYTVVRVIGVGGRVTVFLVCVLFMLVPTFLMGASFPLTARITAGRSGRVASTLGGVYALNTLGAIAGSLAAGYVIAPAFGIRNGILLIAAVNVIVGVAVLNAQPKGRSWEAWAPLGVGALTVLVGFALFPRTQFFVKSAIYQQQFTAMGTAAEVLSYEENADASVTVIRDPAGEKRLYVDTNEAANESRWDAPSHRVIAHVPLLLHPDPKRALVVGFGMGRTSNSIAQHGVHVDAVEISPGVPRAARRFFSQANNGILDSPLFSLHINDGRNYVLTTRARYDMISTGIIHPLVSSGSSSIYSRDFYEMCRDILTEDGVMSQWVPLHRVPLAEFKTILRTFQDVFPDTTVWYKYTPDFLILAGTKNPQSIDFRDWMARAQDPAVDGDLAKDDLDAWSLLDSYFMGPEAVAAFVGDGPLHTDARPVLEFFGTNLGGMMTTQVANIQAMAPHRESVFPLLQPTSFAGSVERDYVRAELARYFDATEKLIEGQATLAAGQYDQAVALYRLAGQLNSADPTIRYHIQETTDLVISELDTGILAMEREIKARLRSNPNDTEALMNLALVYRNGNRLADAIHQFERGIDVEPDNVRLHLALGETHQQSGDMDAAIASFARAAELAPDMVVIHGSLSAMYEQAGRIPEAMDAAREVLRIDPQNPLGYSTLGALYMSQGDVTTAIQHYERALSLNPEAYVARVAWYELGHARVQQGRYPDAIEAFAAALKVDPMFGEARAARLEVERLMGLQE